MRSCYEAEWRLFADSEQATRGRYYFVSDDTPFVAGFHHFGSATWLDGNYPQVQGLGEVLTSKRKWYAGTPPAVLPDRRAIGDCFPTGDMIADGIPYDDCIDGIPPACFAPAAVDKWPDVSTFTRCSLQRFYAKMIEWLYEDQHGRIEEAFKLLLGDDVVVKCRSQAGTMPAMATARLGTIFVCVLDGTRTFQQLALQGLYSLRSPQDFGILETNPFWYGAAAYVYGKLREDGLTVQHRFFITGHSYGAAVACILAALFSAGRALPDIRYLTFGCPKPGGVKLQAMLRRIEGLNLANHNDIVTVLPPDAATLQPVMEALGAPQLRVWIDWMRPANQLGILPNGNVDPNAFPLLDYSTLFAIAADVLSFQSLNPITGHAMVEYQRRLTLRCPDAEWPVSEELSEYLDARPLALRSITVPTGAMGFRSTRAGQGALGFTDYGQLFAAMDLTSPRRPVGDLGLTSPAAGGGGDLGLTSPAAGGGGDLGLTSPAAGGGGDLGLTTTTEGEGEFGLGE